VSFVIRQLLRRIKSFIGREMLLMRRGRIAVKPATAWEIASFGGFKFLFLAELLLECCAKGNSKISRTPLVHN